MTFFTCWRHYIKTTLLIIALSAGQPSLAQHPNSPQPVALVGEYALALDAIGSRWLTVGEETGIQIIDSTGNSIARWQQSAEFLDSRSIQTPTGNKRLFVSFDSNQNRVLLYSLSAQQAIQQEFLSSTIDFPVEGLCLHQDSAQRLHLFLLSELFEARQYLLHPALDEQWEMLPLRSLPTGPVSEFCTVDDASSTLFVSESQQTLWAYSTDPEAEVERQLIDVASPFGNLANGPLGLAASQGRLFVLSNEPATLHQFDLQDEHFQYSSAQTLATMQTAESINLSALDDTLILSLYDEEQTRFSKLSVVSPPMPSVPDSLPEIMPVVETTPMPQRGDAADDPALWIHPTSPSQSLIVGTNKRQGLFVYDLEGQELQRLDIGRLNNVDIRYGARWEGREVDIAVATNRDHNTLALFAIDRDSRQLQLVKELATPLRNIYGMCLYQDTDNRIYAFANDEDGSFVQFALDTSSDEWTGQVVRRFSVATQPEGCVADDKTGQLFLGEEDVGIWTLSAEPNAPTTLQSVAKVGDILKDDVEGLALYEEQDRTFLIASSQGNNSYVVMESSAPFAVLANFRIGLNLSAETKIDGASETDGLELSNANLGGIYSEGLLIVQDGRNVLPEQAQNFKLVPWREVQARFTALRP